MRGKIVNLQSTISRRVHSGMYRGCDALLEVEGQMSFSVDGMFKTTSSRLISARQYASGHMATQWNHTHSAQSHLASCQETHANTIKSVLTRKLGIGQM